MKSLVWMLLMFCMVTGCATAPPEPVEDPFAKLKKENPVTVLVVPAINKSTAANAPDFYLSTIAEPLTQKGYYVLPIPIAKEIFQLEGIVDGKQLVREDYSIYHQHFGADALLFVTIMSWDTNYAIVAGNVTVRLGFELISTQSSDILWRDIETVTVETSGNGNNGLLGAIIETALNTATQDYIPIAREVNRRTIGTLPAGYYRQLVIKKAEAEKEQKEQQKERSPDSQPGQ